MEQTELQLGGRKRSAASSNSSDSSPTAQSHNQQSEHGSESFGALDSENQQINYRHKLKRVKLSGSETDNHRNHHLIGEGSLSAEDTKPIINTDPKDKQSEQETMMMNNTKPLAPNGVNKMLGGSSGNKGNPTTKKLVIKNFGKTLFEIHCSQIFTMIYQSIPLLQLSLNYQKIISIRR